MFAPEWCVSYTERNRSLWHSAVFKDCSRRIWRCGLSRLRQNRLDETRMRGEHRGRSFAPPSQRGRSTPSRHSRRTSGASKSSEVTAWNSHTKVHDDRDDKQTVQLRPSVRARSKASDHTYQIIALGAPKSWPLLGHFFGSDWLRWVV